MPRKKQHIFINTRMTTYEKLRGTSTHELAILGVDMPGIGKISILSGTTGMLERREVQECCIYCVPLTSEKGRVRYVHLTGPDALAEDLLTPVIAHPCLPADQADAGTRTARMAASGLRPSRRPVATMERRSA